jgi:AAA15 family ATPase/GTPase
MNSLIQSIQITNFKSFQNLTLNCKQFNILIGPPNSGKSCFLEALALYSCVQNKGRIEDFVRFIYENDLCYRRNCKEPYQIMIKTKSGDFPLDLKSSPLPNRTQIPIELKLPINYYKFKKIFDTYSNHDGLKLQTPFGQNLFNFLYQNQDYLEEIREILSEFNIEFMLDTDTKKIKYFPPNNPYKMIAFEYPLLPDTIQRYILHYLAIRSNPNSVLIFEEPEAHIYPVYIKLLSEMIGSSKDQQFFISTHNPLFLTILLEKVGSQNINIIKTTQTDEGTKFDLMDDSEKNKIFELDYDIFFQI